jgi:hypothetical protein
MKAAKSSSRPGLFATPVPGTRQGKVVLVELRDHTDPETGGRYTVKRYESTKAPGEAGWQHERIRLRADNPEFPALELTGREGEVRVVAEWAGLL